MRDFLWEMENKGEKIFRFQYNYNSTVEENLDNFKLFLQANNVDFGANANDLQAITSAVLNEFHDAKSWFNEEIQGLIRDTIEAHAYNYYDS